MFKPSPFIRTLQSRGYPQRGPSSWVGRIPFNPRVFDDVTEAWRPVSWRLKVNFGICNEVVLSTSDFPEHFLRPLSPNSSRALSHFVWISCWREMMKQMAWPQHKLSYRLYSIRQVWPQFPNTPVLHPTICRDTLSFQGPPPLGSFCPESPVTSRNGSQIHMVDLVDSCIRNMKLLP